MSPRFSLVLLALVLFVQSVSHGERLPRYLAPGVFVESSFQIRNNTDQEWTIGELEPDCPCLTILSKPTALPAGQSGEVRVRYRGGSPGPVSVNIEADVFPAGKQTWEFQGLEVVDPHSTAIFAGDATKVIKEWWVIDARPEADFNAVHIPGAVRMTFAELRSRPWPKETRLLLVGRDFQTKSLAVVATELRRAGVGDAKVIEGGIEAWIGASQPVEGGVSQDLAMHVLHSSDLVSAYSLGQWRVINATADPVAPATQEVIKVNEPSTVKTALVKAVKTDNRIGTVIFLPRGLLYGTLHRELLSSLPAAYFAAPEPAMLLAAAPGRSKTLYISSSETAGGLSAGRSTHCKSCQ